MTRTLVKLLTPGALLLGLAGCSGTGSTTSVTEADALLNTAQCTFESNRAAAEACFHDFEACLAAPDADAAACRATLQACLPVPPPPPFGLDGGPHSGGCGHGHGGEGDHDDDDADDHADGGRGPMGPPWGHPGPHSGPVGPRMGPNPAAVQACHDTFKACLAATPGAACFQAERDCMQAAFESAFQAVCQSVMCNPTDPPCANLLQRCADGVGSHPDAFDGGACP